MTITNRVSLKSVEFGITPIDDVPDAPTIGAATNVGTSRAFNNGSATVAYTAAPTGGPVTTFTATSTPGSFTGTGASPITVAGLQSATSYTFTVSAANSNGTLTSAASSSITATTVPQAPTIGTFTDGGTGTTGTLSFTAGATGGSSITNYKYSTDSSTYTALSPSQTSSPLSLTGLTAGTYNFSVKAVNANGDSAASGTVSGTVITPSSYESIATVTGTGSSGTISFTSIPSTYKHLQIRYNGRCASGAITDHYIRLNSDTGSNYTRHWLYALDSGGPYLSSAANTTPPSMGYVQGYGTHPTTIGIVDIIDYQSTSKNKTIKFVTGSSEQQLDHQGAINLGSSLWMNSANAVTQIDLILASSNWSTTSSFALYGIKG